MNPSEWKGPVGMALGGLLYKAQFKEDDANFEAQANNLFDEILRVAGGRPAAAGGSAHPHGAPQQQMPQQQAIAPHHQQQMQRQTSANQAAPANVIMNPGPQALRSFARQASPSRSSSFTRSTRM